VLTVKGRFPAVSVVAWGLLTAGCAGVSTSSSVQPLISISGSAAVYPITEAVAEEFQNQNQDVRTTVGISDTAAGLGELCSGRADLANAARPIVASEMRRCADSGTAFLEIPVAYDALVVAVSPKNTWAADISPSELKALWGGNPEPKVVRWNQVRAEWPDREVHLYGPPVDSDTMQFFAAAILGAHEAVRPDYRIQPDETALVDRLSADEQALGICGYVAFSQSGRRLKALALGASGKEAPAVQPTPAAVRSGTYAPLSRPLFIYVSEKALARPEVRNFVDYYLKEGPWVTDQVGGIQLGEKAHDLVRRRVSAGTLGSAFAGDAAAGVTLAQLLARLQ
jgi:phosphate transport system substrate-binding protein